MPHTSDTHTPSNPATPAAGWRSRLRFNRDLVISLGLRWLPAFDRLLMRFAATPDHQVFPRELFPWIPQIEANWEAVRNEAAEILRDRMAVPSIREVSPDHDKIALDEKWRSFFLWGYGLKVKANCARCPATAEMLDQIPNLLTAFYSVMLAGAHVPRHTGPTKAILTAHLGLIIPLKRDRCHMEVGEHDVIWEQGKVVVFDDMYPHEVWNDTDEDRIILLMHLKRPLRFPGTWLRDSFFAILRASPFVKDGVRNLERWEKDRAAA